MAADQRGSKFLRCSSREDAEDNYGPAKNLVARVVAPVAPWFRKVVLRSGQLEYYTQTNKSTTERNWAHGWKLDATASCSLIGTILCFNIAFTIYCMKAKPPGDNGIGKITSGDCHKILSTSTAIHIVINVLSTVLVAASNYNIQCLSAPTRAEIDAAHERHTYLEIGTQSLRNIRVAPKWE